ncbi:DUF317 domain-containing protein [Streptomyces sp. NPDC050085]|uniref:DUF317 domain-containing protein n=1 Tax=Streptomyces sp. NPDC050085 TaxID=3365600 RepID=UPI0037B63495
MSAAKTAWQRPDTARQYFAVTPRHLAGPGHFSHVTEHLRACGWKDRSPRRGGQIVFENPQRTARVTYDPASAPPGWTIAGRTVDGTSWHVAFSMHTPAEAIAGLTDALTRPLSPLQEHLNVWAPLQQQNWSTAQGRHFTASSPDGTAAVQYRQTVNQDGRAEAMWWAAARTEHGRLWDATFSQHTPMQLIAAFTTTLADPRPLLRERGAHPATKFAAAASVHMRPSQAMAHLAARLHQARQDTWARHAPAAHRTTSSAGRRR